MAIWVIKLFCSSVCSCHFLISSAYFWSLLFLSFIVHIFAWNFPVVSLIFLKRSLVFPQFHCFLLLRYIVHLGKLSYVSLLFFGTLCSVGFIFPFLFCLSLLFFSQLFVLPLQTIFLPSCISFSLGWFVTASCTLWISAHSSPGSLCTRYNTLSPPLQNHKPFDLWHIWMA